MTAIRNRSEERDLKKLHSYQLEVQKELEENDLPN